MKCDQLPQASACLACHGGLCFQAANKINALQGSMQKWRNKEKRRWMHWEKPHWKRPGIPHTLELWEDKVEIRYKDKWRESLNKIPDLLGPKRDGNAWRADKRTSHWGSNKCHTWNTTR